ncbi:4-alpha-glucanotransferase [Saccharophagus sp. K07]|jgi:4-alpha-glucanotransferase|uniref:4-alpha-glucanotransferase n=1 Tax=Saccharophagus sp. K07 TaxID=2283636 RepID=UPI001651F537|nr:4-alpha-glucanotransferase [Saccharophagus sp. K07]MBC6903884.1 4-alpha-glucanotransferase [Saccharophagus sp. K07]
MNNLDKLFYWRGIADEYYNYRGERVFVSLENRQRLLQAMGVNVDSPEAIAEQAYALDIEPWRTWFPPMLMTEVGGNAHFTINLPPSHLPHKFHYEIFLESGGTRSGEFVAADCPEVGDYLYEGTRYSRRAIGVHEVPIGYHRLRVIMVSDSGASMETQFVVVPSQAYTPEWVTEEKHPWGIIVQLYTLRSARNWGIGDFTDLKLLITEAAAAGADMIGLNPLHALRIPVENHCSPYSPSDRRFLNPLYIDPEVEPEYQKKPGDMLPILVRLRAQDKVPYAAVYSTKMSVFREMYAVFVANELDKKSPRAQKFLEFVAKAGPTLQDFCLYQVLAEATGQQIDQLSAEEKESARSRYAEQIQFHAYLQWLADAQLEACQRLAHDKGMKVGLMRDLAVGADGGGAEVTTNLHLFCRSAAVGAPPDPLAEKGQNWGLPPMDPATLRATGFAHFINLLRTNMAHCGALRIDHAMALMRLWWCPPGQTADYGAYIYYPFKEMLGLLKLESVRNQCVVIGEDMGVVPQEFREALINANIFTNKLFYFEKLHDGQFRPPEQYEPHSLAMLTNHDVPTIASWWIGSDLQLRAKLNLLEDGVGYEEVSVQRDMEKLRLLEWLANLGLVKREEFAELLAGPMTQAFAATLLHGVSKCSSQLFVVQLEDLELLEDPVNVPGTSYQYPNWQRKLAVPLEMLFSEERVQSLLRAIAMERS